MQLPGDLVDIGLQLLGFKRPGQGPAHVAGSVSHVDADAAGAPLFIICHGLNDEWHHCKRATVSEKRWTEGQGSNKGDFSFVFEHQICFAGGFLQRPAIDP